MHRWLIEEYRDGRWTGHKEIFGRRSAVETAVSALIREPGVKFRIRRFLSLHEYAKHRGLAVDCECAVQGFINCYCKRKRREHS